MTKLLIAVVLVDLVAVTGAAGNPKAAEDKKEPSKKKPVALLKAGDPAPALKASKWLQGEEVREFQPGKVYVVASARQASGQAPPRISTTMALSPRRFIRRSKSPIRRSSRVNRRAGSGTR